MLHLCTLPRQEVCKANSNPDAYTKFKSFNPYKSKRLGERKHDIFDLDLPYFGKFFNRLYSNHDEAKYIDKHEDIEIFTYQH